MKTRALIVAALLVSGLGAFAACGQDSGKAPQHFGAYIPPTTTDASALVAYGLDLNGSTSDAQTIAAIHGAAGDGGAVPLSNGAYLTAQIDSGASIDLTGAYYGAGAIKGNALLVHPNPHAFGIGLVDMDTVDGGPLELGTAAATNVDIGAANTPTEIHGGLTCDGPVTLAPTITTASTGALSEIGAQGSSAATGTGGTLLLFGGTATGVTAGTGGPVILQRQAPSAAGNESFIEMERGSTPDFAFGGWNNANSKVAIWLGSTNVGSRTIGNATLIVNQAGGFSELNDNTEVDIGIGATTYATFNTSATILGSSGSGAALDLNGPALTGTQLVASTGSNLLTTGHWHFLPVTINGQAGQIPFTW